MNEIQWYPGHMAKAFKEIEEKLKLVDIVIELRDARMPEASFNPVFDELFLNKPRLIILNKSDLADNKENNKWLEYFGKEFTLLTNSNGDNLNKLVVNKVKDILKDKILKAKAKGIRKKVLKAMVVGIPNVGKSTFINNIIKKKVAKTENRPGVTKSVSWININDDLMLLDTPGVLWPKFEDQKKAKILACLGSINEDILDKVELASFILNHLYSIYPQALKDKYDISSSEDLLKQVALNKKCVSKNNEVDLSKAAELVLNDVKNNRLGRLTYEIYGTRE